jgi:hypothetical protein
VCLCCVCENVKCELNGSLLEAHDQDRLDLPHSAVAPPWHYAFEGPGGRSRCQGMGSVHRFGPPDGFQSYCRVVCTSPTFLARPHVPTKTTRAGPI